jgi:hypothetical protein
MSVKYSISLIDKRGSVSRVYIDLYTTTGFMDLRKEKSGAVSAVSVGKEWTEDSAERVKPKNPMGNECKVPKGGRSV